MKKLKVLLGAVALIASMALVSCGDPVNTTTGEGTGGVRTWEKAVTNSANITDNGDGTATVTLTSSDNGNGVIVYINADKSSLEAGKTVKVSFDYETVEGKWTDSTKNPKFKVQLGKGGTGWWNVEKAQSGNEYYDADRKNGSMDLEFTSLAGANELLIQFNAWQWNGEGVTDTGDDQVKVTIKSITVE
jgi:uncharacterized protein (DUF736 family)